ncbi:MAG TPA: hypothetical protein PLH57_01105 [Oligoflexia bacterium]|nr:hypothetical protein [Oligoflexia bacterium]
MSMNAVRLLALFSLVVAVAAAGCGGNASVMRGKPGGGDGSSGGAVQPSTEAGTDADESSDDDLIVEAPVGASGPQDGSPIDGTDGDDGDDANANNGKDGDDALANNGNGEDGANGTGKDGKDGIDGKDGKDGETRIVEVPAVQEPTIITVRGEKGDPGLTACNRGEVFPMPAMSAIPMSPSEMASFVTPLLETPSSEDIIKKIKKRNKKRSDDVPMSISKLSLGENSPGKKLVHDSQVLFKIPVTLPPRKYIVGASKVFINIRTIKTRGDGKKGDGHDETEFFALLGHNPKDMIMSGYRYDAVSQWYWATAFNNPAFPETQNRAYSQMMVDSIARQTAGKRSSQPIEVTVAVDMNQIIAGSAYNDILDYLYRDVTDYTRAANVDVNIAVGDDTKVLDAKIEMTFLKDTCAEAEDRGIQK